MTVPLFCGYLALYPKWSPDYNCCLGRCCGKQAHNKSASEEIGGKDDADPPQTSNARPEARTVCVATQTGWKKNVVCPKAEILILEREPDAKYHAASGGEPEDQSGHEGNRVIPHFSAVFPL